MENRMLKLLHRERELLLSKLAILEKAIEVYSKPAATIHLRQSGKFSRDTAEEDEFLYTQLTHRYPDFDEKTSVKSKVLLVLRREERFMHVREIAKIFRYLGYGKSMQHIIRSISPALSVMKKEVIFGVVCVEAENSQLNTFWGLKDWMDAEGKILPEYSYNQKEISPAGMRRQRIC